MFSPDEFELLCEENQNLVKEAQNNREKMFFVGKSLLEGENGFSTNVPIGFKYIKQSIEMESVDSIIYYVQMLIKGDIIPQNLDEALKIIDQHEAFQNQLINLKGKILKLNNKFAKAFECFKKGASLDDGESMCQCGKMTFLGKGTQMNETKAFTYFENSEKKGNVKAHHFQASYNMMTIVKGFKNLSADIKYIFIKKGVKNIKQKRKPSIVINPSQTEQFYLTRLLTDHFSFKRKASNFIFFLKNIVQLFNDVSIEVSYPSKMFESIFNILTKIKMNKVENLKIGVSLLKNSDLKLRIDKEAVSPYISYHTIDPSLNKISNQQFKSCFLLKTIIIPPSIQRIGKEAFSNCYSLNKVVIPSSITEIDSFTFFNCKSLEEISIPSSVEYLGESCFENCISLKQIVIHSSMIEKSAFKGCLSLSKVEILSPLEEIVSFTFEGCRSLEHITIPPSLIKIEDSAFAGCEKLLQIVIPSSTKIDQNAFPPQTKVIKQENE